MLRFIYLFLLILLIACCEEASVECPCFSESQNPIYKGCEPGTIYDLEADCAVMGMYAQLYNVIKYPPEAREDSIQGIVTIIFDVLEDGSMGNIEAVNDTLGYGLADAALEAVMTLTDRGFCPARENCTAVAFHYTLPIKFVLQ